MENKIFVSSTAFDIGDEIENGVLKDFEFNSMIQASGVGGDWHLPLANIMNNEIVINIVSTIAVETAILIVKTLYTKFKGKQSKKMLN
ncbi:hypothetical protein [Erysipelothrix anatis]|uniref:hypothetical protein n=1 Tax=Erysipelothrix anatis TaxID=2683713 RepID=UPI0013595D90|nr:hypothetical protein [Erysipelothrix anatis]